MMKSWDDTEETVPQSVTTYYFEDEEQSPISFSVLPIQLDDREKHLAAASTNVYLRGSADDGLQKVYKKVVSWKLILSGSQPHISVLSQENKWINLLKPRKSYYEDTIRTLMITIHFLHFLRRCPKASPKILWSHLCKVFSTFEVRPSNGDLKDHLSLIKVFSERDEILAKSPVLLWLLDGNWMKRFGQELNFQDVLSDPEAKGNFIVDTDGIYCEYSNDLCDDVCAICDDGGDLLSCEGACLRSFHAKISSGKDSNCETLLFTEAEVESMMSFLCKNCLCKQHQCFACGKLGSSDTMKGAEVYLCASKSCGHFYHPDCVAGLLFPDNKAQALECQKKIAAGKSFICSVHRCIVCKEGENKEFPELQFAICRRCPKSFHRKCLPREIAFKDIEAENIVQRAWEDLLPNRILIYCLNHEIVGDTKTPRRNHIIFPHVSPRENDEVAVKGNAKVFKKKRRDESKTRKKRRHTFQAFVMDKTFVKEAKISEKAFNSEETKSVLKEKQPGDLGKCIGLNKRRFGPRKKTGSPKQRKSDEFEVSEEEECDQPSAMSASPRDQIEAGSYLGDCFSSEQMHAPRKEIHDQPTSSSLIIEHAIMSKSIKSTSILDDIDEISRRQVDAANQGGKCNPKIPGWTSSEMAPRDFHVWDSETSIGAKSTNSGVSHQFSSNSYSASLCYTSENARNDVDQMRRSVFDVPEDPAAVHGGVMDMPSSSFGFALAPNPLYLRPGLSGGWVDN